MSKASPPLKVMTNWPAIVTHWTPMNHGFVRTPWYLCAVSHWSRKASTTKATWLMQWITHQMPMLLSTRRQLCWLNVHMKINALYVSVLRTFELPSGTKTL